MKAPEIKLDIEKFAREGMIDDHYKDDSDTTTEQSGDWAPVIKIICGLILALIVGMILYFKYA